LPYPVDFQSDVPEFHRFELVALFPFPSGSALIQALPRTVPFIGCGHPKHIAAAFRLGASDYLCDPWTEFELSARVGRLLQKTVLPLPSAHAVLRGTRLEGWGATISLTHEESALLRILYREKGKDISRVALRRLLWPRTTENSRIVDETVSRLRAKLDKAGISKSYMEIRSVRGFGYRLEVSH
jgi:DNA-binding response OmpR family regulator